MYSKRLAKSNRIVKELTFTCSWSLSSLCNIRCSQKQNTNAMFLPSQRSCRCWKRTTAAAVAANIGKQRMALAVDRCTALLPWSWSVVLRRWLHALAHHIATSYHNHLNEQWRFISASLSTRNATSGQDSSVAKGVRRGEKSRQGYLYIDLGRGEKNLYAETYIPVQCWQDFPVW